MIFVYSIKEKGFVTKEVSNINAPMTDQPGITFVVTQKYIFWLGPVAPTQKKTVTAFSSETDHPIPIALWNEEIKKQAIIAKSEVKGGWKLFTFPLVLVAFFLVAGVNRIIVDLAKSSSSNTEKQVLNDPQPNDLFYKQVTINSSEGDTEAIAPFSKFIA